MMTESYCPAMATAGVQYHGFEGVDYWHLIAAADLVLPYILRYSGALGSTLRSADATQGPRVAWGATGET